MTGTSEPLLNISNGQTATNLLSDTESLQVREIKNLGNAVMFLGVAQFLGLLIINSELIVDPDSENGETVMVAVNSIAFLPAIIKALKLGRLTNESVPYLWFATMLAQAVQGLAELLGDIYDIEYLSNIADGLFALGLVLSGGAMFKMVKNFNDRKNDFNAAVCFAISIALELSAMKVSGNSVIAIKAASCLGVIAAGYFVGKTADDFIDEKKAGRRALNADDPEEIEDLESNAALIAENRVHSRASDPVGQLGSNSVFNPVAAAADAAARGNYAAANALLKPLTQSAQNGGGSRDLTLGGSGLSNV